MVFCMELFEKINEVAAGMQRQVTLMEVCGGHTRVIMDAGIRGALPKNVRLVSGPGCPVCVTSQQDIDCMIALAKEGVPVATYGDMLRVPGSSGSLDDARRDGANVVLVSSVLEVPKKYVFFGMGFETTAPMTAHLLKHGGVAYSSHKAMPPALAALAGECRIDGFIAPGHVSAIIGSDAYRNIAMPQVICGFTPEKVLHAIYLLLREIGAGKKEVVNDYPEAVKPEGNIAAKKLMHAVFDAEDAEWRGLGTIKNSGLGVRNEKQDAKKIYADVFGRIKISEKSACMCGDVLRGMVEPQECPLYGKTCTPDSPRGACMVSLEGTCRIYYGGGIA